MEDDESKVASVGVGAIARMMMTNHVVVEMKKIDMFFECLLFCFVRSRIFPRKVPEF